MTYAEELLKEGMEKGLEKGLRRGELQDKPSVLTRLLSRRFELTDTERDPVAAPSSR